MWGPDQEAAFKELKLGLASLPLLRYPKEGEPYTLETDASDVGIGAALYQGEGEEREVVAHASRTLSAAERNYLVTDREGLAAVWAVKHFQVYLLGVKFTLITDHAALKWLMSKEILEGRMKRWADALMEYHFKIQYQ